MIAASFDIGEKNFAYCIGSSEKIHVWRHHNVMKKNRQPIIESCISISNILDDEDWSICDKIIIEQQIRSNVRAQRVAQHVWTWFHCKYPSIVLCFVRSSLKTQYFLGKNTLTNKGRKKWAIEKTISILKEREDNDHLIFLETHPKKDDLSDTLLQLISSLAIN
jgi:hypothetical protein